MSRHSPRAFLLASVLIGVTPADAAGPAALEGARRVVFLGDSITYSGQYVEYAEAYLRLWNPGFACEFLDLGLPSETVSGLSEPGHAAGKFPRPNLHERLVRVLDKTRPDLVVACYGMNDGIYHPFSEERFRAFRDGITSLRARAGAAGAKVLHLTPPVFDAVPVRAKTLPAGLDEYRQPFEGYDGVLGRYAGWLLERKIADGWDVVDVHGPMRAFLDAERGRDADYRLANDGVHANSIGHWLIARQLLVHWGVPSRELDAAATGEAAAAAFPRGREVLALVQRRQRLLKDAWLSATGHTRPGMKAGRPLADAEREAAGLAAELHAILTPAP